MQGCEATVQSCINRWSNSSKRIRTEHHSIIPMISFESRWLKQALIFIWNLAKNSTRPIDPWFPGASARVAMWKIQIRLPVSPPLRTKRRAKFPADHRSRNSFHCSWFRLSLSCIFLRSVPSHPPSPGNPIPWNNRGRQGCMHFTAPNSRKQRGSWNGIDIYLV